MVELQKVQDPLPKKRHVILGLQRPRIQGILNKNGCKRLKPKINSMSFNLFNPKPHFPLVIFRITNKIKKNSYKLHLLKVFMHGSCGRSSVVECNLAKVDVEGSNPFARSSLRSYELRLTGHPWMDC